MTFIISILLVGCKYNSSSQYIYRPPENINDGINVGTLNEVNIDSSTWAVKYENGVDANNLKITPRDMAKIGVTFLNNGIWNGKKIIPEQWFLKNTISFPCNNKIVVLGENGYSYSW